MRFRFSVSGQADLEAEPANDHDDHECSHMSDIASPASWWAALPRTMPNRAIGVPLLSP